MEYPMNMTVGMLKQVLDRCPDDNMSVVIPVIDEEDHNVIRSFCMVRNAAILRDEYMPEAEQRVLCLNTSVDGLTIRGQITKSGRDVECEQVLF